MDDIWNQLKQVAEQGGRKAACQVKKWGDQASAQGRLWQIRREIRELYVKIGRCCWEKYRRESEPLFSELFSRFVFWSRSSSLWKCGYISGKTAKSSETHCNPGEIPL